MVVDQNIDESPVDETSRGDRAHRFIFARFILCRFIPGRFIRERHARVCECGAVRTGVWLYPAAPAERLVDAIRILDDGGVDEVWVADEGVARDPFAVLAVAAVRTPRIRLGVGITSPLLRHPGAAASAAMTIDELAGGGRFVLGWGVGGHESLGPFGLTADKPVRLLAEALRTARAVVEGTDDDRYHPPAHAAPARSIPQYVGARGPQLNALASREADGVFLSGFPDRDDSDATLTDVVTIARSVRPIDVALYSSIRFRTSADQWSTAGSADELADHLVRLAIRHRPTCIGAALVDGDDPVTMAEDAVRTFHSVRDRLPPSPD